MCTISLIFELYFKNNFSNSITFLISIAWCSKLEIVLFKDYQKRLNSDQVIIVGDFNLNERHKVWDSFYKAGYKSAVTNSKTTLKRKCKDGNYLSHAIDNIYFSKQISFVNSGVVDYIKTCENLVPARLVSDHLPVFLEFSF